MKRIGVILTAVLMLHLGLFAQGEAQLVRRQISTDAPAWIVHIDCWNYPDPEKIIDLIDEDLRPFAIFSIALSSNDNLSPNGPAIIDSWIKTCAAKGVWCMIQPSSGAHNRLPEITATGEGREAYEQYYRDYPNFLGFSFAEQFWDFGQNGCPTWEERQQTIIALLEMAHRYGGYLTMSFTQSYDNCLMMPLGMMKNNAALLDAFANYGAHFICCEKTTMKKGFYDIESNCLGMWLSGYAGHYGIRFDTSGWMSNTDELNDASNNPYVEAAGIAPIVEHMLTSGQTVLDGPELTWQQVTRSAYTTTQNGWKVKKQELFPQCVNIYEDIMRKVIAGDWRILSRSEVIARTKICIVNDITSGAKNPYVTPKTLFDGLYRFNVDAGGVTYGAGWQDQRWWMKKSGRYPAIPQVYDLLDSESQQLTAIPASTLSSRWTNTNAKIQELSQLFPPVSSGEVFVAKAGDTYVTYNPYQYSDVTTSGVRVFTNATKTVTGNIDSISIADGGTVRIYLNNYQNNYLTSPYAEKAQQTNEIVLRGLISQPQLQWADRADHSASTVTSSFNNGNLTLTITHNGALDITISDIHAVKPTIGLNYKPYTVGVVTTDHTLAPLTAPAAPAAYKGVQQYEVENMDYKGSTITVNNNPGSNTLSDYYAQGYVSVIPRTDAFLRDTIIVPETGEYTLAIRYLSSATVTAVPLVLKLNNTAITLPAAAKATDWTELQTDITLAEGANEIQLGFSAYWATSSVQLDCITVTPKDSTTSVSNVQRDDVPCTKVLDGERLIIIKNNKRYTILGQYEK